MATLIHDSYLPVYVQEELGLSNTKVGSGGAGEGSVCEWGGERVAEGLSGEDT